MNIWVRCLMVATMALAAMAPAAASAAPPADRGSVALLTLNGPIGPAAAEYFHDASSRAASDGARAIVLQIDTPGGLSTSMRAIIADMLASPLPVLVYVAPGGARAASAGTYILYAAQVAVMAPGTHLGAATPVSIAGKTPMPASLPKGSGDSPSTAASSSKPTSGTSSPEKTAQSSGDAESNKVLNDSLAYIRSLAQLRGRNATWAEQAVRGAATLTATEAAQRHVINFVANDVGDLLAKAEGLRVEVGQHEVVLKLKGLAVREYAPSARALFLGVITNPTVAYLLLLAGIAGLLIEATHPGVFLPGVAGGICLLVGLYALQLLPVSYAGLALMTLGIGLLVAEALTPTVGALGIGGAIAFVLGSIMLMDTGVPGYGVNLGVIAGIAVAAVVLLGGLLWLVFRTRETPLDSGDQLLLDATGELLEPISAGGTSWARVYGERWKVYCESALPAHAPLRVLRREGLLLWVAPLPQNPAPARANPVSTGRPSGSV